MISIVIPTIDGREDYFARCIESYEKNTQYEYEFIILRNRKCCGVGWNEGASLAKGKYIHLTCDDQEAVAGWDTTAVETVENGFMPSCIVHYPEQNYTHYRYPGKADWEQVPMSTIPFFSAEMWKKIGPTIPMQYYIDDFIGWMGEIHGIPTVMRHGYQFNHYMAQYKRGAGLPEGERMVHDQRYYANAQQLFLSGQLDRSAWLEDRDWINS